MIHRHFLRKEKPAGSQESAAGRIIYFQGAICVDRIVGGRQHDCILTGWRCQILIFMGSQCGTHKVADRYIVLNN